jgi:hypothetical protein
MNITKKIVLFSFLVLCGCSRESMTNDEIIEETKKCENSGLNASPVLVPVEFMLISNETVKIECRPKNTNERPNAPMKHCMMEAKQ